MWNFLDMWECLQEITSDVLRVRCGTMYFNDQVIDLTQSFRRRCEYRSFGAFDVDLAQENSARVLQCHVIDKLVERDRRDGYPIGAGR